MLLNVVSCSSLVRDCSRSCEVVADSYSVCDIRENVGNFEVLTNNRMQRAVAAHLAGVGVLIDTSNWSAVLLVCDSNYLFLTCILLFDSCGNAMHFLINQSISSYLISTHEVDSLIRSQPPFILNILFILKTLGFSSLWTLPLPQKDVFLVALLYAEVVLPHFALDIIDLAF